MLVACAPMAARTKPLLFRRADMSERSVISYHKIQQYNKALEKTLQRLEQDAQNNIITQKLAAKKIRDEWEQRQTVLARKRSSETQLPTRAVDESESQEWDKASVSPRESVVRRVVRSGSVGTLQLASPNLRKAYELGENADHAKCQQQLHSSPVFSKHSRNHSVGAELSSLAFHRTSGDRRTSVPIISSHHPSSKKKLVPVRRLASDELPGRSVRMPTITLTKEADATVSEESEDAADSPTMAPPRNVKCNAWESKSNSSLTPSLQRLPLSSSPTLIQHSPMTSSTHSMPSCSTSSPGLYRVAFGSEDECPTFTGSLLPIKSRKRPLTGLNARRSSSGCISLSALKASQTTRKEDLLEAARMMNFGPEASKSHNPTMFKKFYSHVPIGKSASVDSSRDVSLTLIEKCFMLPFDHNYFLFFIGIFAKNPQRKQNEW